jgi:hypothetical protein
MFPLVLQFCPVFGIGQRVFLLGNVWPSFAKFGVQLEIFLLVFRKFIFRINGVDGALGFA